MKRVLLTMLLTTALVPIGTASAHNEHHSSAFDSIFSTTCANGRTSHYAKDDPIVYPGKSGASHLHEFFGNNSTNANSTYSSMVTATTDCNFKGDTAGYWTPTLIKPDGTRVPAYNHWVYYRIESGWSQNVVPFPPDLKIIAGGAGSPLYQAQWRCASPPSGSSKIILNCPGASLSFEVVFPQCWDGVNTDSPDHRSHMSYSVVTEANGLKHCPASHPVRVPKLSVFGLWAGLTNAKSLGYRLSSDTGTQHGETLHADFWNTWLQPELERVTTTCFVNHDDIPESPNSTINGVRYDPSCLQADSKFVT